MTAVEQILTVTQMRAAEQALIDSGETVASLMERAGTGAADWVRRLAAGRAVTVLCGPGNNGGDGYVMARELARNGSPVTVVAPLDPQTEAAAAARASYARPTAAESHGGVLVDCLFGSGLTRPLEPVHLALLGDLARHHRLRIALDVRASQEAAIHLYESLGFERWGENPNYAMVEGKPVAGYYYTKTLRGPRGRKGKSG